MFLLFGLVGCEEERIKIEMPIESNMSSESLYLDIDRLDFNGCKVFGYSFLNNKEYDEELFMKLFKDYMKEFDLIMIDSWRGPDEQIDSTFSNLLFSNSVGKELDGKIIDSVMCFIIYHDRLYVWIPYYENIGPSFDDGTLYVSTEEVKERDFRLSLESILSSAGGSL